MTDQKDRGFLLSLSELHDQIGSEIFAQKSRYQHDGRPINVSDRLSSLEREFRDLRQEHFDLSCRGHALDQVLKDNLRHGKNLCKGLSELEYLKTQLDVRLKQMVDEQQAQRLLFEQKIQELDARLTQQQQEAHAKIQELEQRLDHPGTNLTKTTHRELCFEEIDLAESSTETPLVYDLAIPETTVFIPSSIYIVQVGTPTGDGAVENDASLDLGDADSPLKYFPQVTVKDNMPVQSRILVSFPSDSSPATSPLRITVRGTPAGGRILIICVGLEMPRLS